MPQEALTALQALLKPMQYPKGAKIIGQGTLAAELYFLTSGRVDVAVQIRPGKGHRVSTIEAGNMFGELALFGGAARTADVIAALDSEALILDRDGIAALQRDNIEAYCALLLAVGGSLAERLRRANTEIGALSK